MYSVRGYGNMIADRPRTNAFVQALRQAIKSDSVVVDIGTGTGIFALLACRLGARKVYAIEPDDAIQVAREIAAANGYGQKIIFIQDMSTHVTLPELADVVISDLVGVFPWFTQHIPSIVDARRRLLAPDGVLIPRCDTMWAVVVNAPDPHRRFTSPWDDNDYGLDMGAARQIATNTWSKGHVTPEQYLTEPQIWATLDYATIENPNVDARVMWTAARRGTAHGLIVWFDREVAAGITLRNGPDVTDTLRPEKIYQTAFFPWSEPIVLGAGDTITCSLRAILVGDDYIWSWDTHVLDGGNEHRVKADFKQSTFYGVPLSPAKLRKKAASFVPHLDDEGAVDRLILSLMDGSRSLEEIARELKERFPARYKNWRDALTRAGELSVRYGKGE